MRCEPESRRNFVKSPVLSPEKCKNKTMDSDIIDARNYFRRSAVRAKTLVRGDPLVGSGLIVIAVYSGNAEVAEVMRGSAKTISRIMPNGALSAESATDPTKIGMKLASGYVLVKASATGKDDVDENAFFLAPAAAMIEIWQFEEAG